MEIENLDQLVGWMEDTDQFNTLGNSPIAQFGTVREPYLGAELLPEYLETDNNFEDNGLDVSGEIGNSGADYSPAQLNKAMGAFNLNYSLGKIDAATQLVGRDIEQIIKFLSKQKPSANPVEDARSIITKWFDEGVTRSLAKLIEHQRWQCIVDGVVKRRGSNGYSENVPYPFGPGHQTTVASSGTMSAPAGWYDTNPATAADALEDLLAANQRLKDQGFKLIRIVSRSTIKSVFMRNGKVRRNALPDGSLRSATPADIQALLDAHDLPPWTTYDTGFKHRLIPNSPQITTVPFLERDTFDPVVLVAATSNEQQIKVGKETIVLPDTLGGYAIGRPKGQAKYGKLVSIVLHKKTYPHSVYAEIVAQGLPIISARVLAQGLPFSVLKVPKRAP